MPSQSACVRSTRKRSGPVLGTSGERSCSESRYSRITRESKSELPSSSTSAGILFSGFTAESVASAFVGTGRSSSRSMRRSRPSSRAATSTLRTKGDVGV